MVEHRNGQHANDAVATAGPVPARPVATDREPHFFGPPGARLYGCHHLPHPRTTVKGAVLLCYPMGQEYIRSHRSYLQLATRLARAGYHVLRFDLRGTGDSAGEIHEARLDTWIEDTNRACDHLREISGITTLRLAGLRLGATIAWLTAAGRTDVDQLVLWEPVVSGETYLRDLREQQEKMLRTAYVDRRSAGGLNELTEVLGFPLPTTLRGDLAALDVLHSPAPRSRMLVVESGRGAGHARGDVTRTLAEHLRGRGSAVDTAAVDAPRVWQEEPFRALVPHKVIVCIEQWLSRPPG